MKTENRPLSSGTYTYDWEHGRELISLTKANGEQVLFTYDATGFRTSQMQKDGSGEVVASCSYIYNGSKITRMTYNNRIVDFTYDANGQPMTMTIDGQTYYYITNLQGDVVSIKDNTGTMVACYTYDAWGTILTQTGTLATLNPLRYRGYVYDEYTGWYYLQSRYYSPTLCRFINSDVYTTTGQELIGNNMFAYCNNNPVMGYDPTGAINWRGVALGVGLGVLAVAAAALTVVTYGAASPLVATTVLAIGTTVTAALVETSVTTTVGAIQEAPVVYDITVISGNERTGVSLVYDYGEDTSDWYAHTGAQTSKAYGSNYGTGIVFDYDEPGDYGGSFVDASISTKYNGAQLGCTYCTSPDNLVNGYTSSHAFLFTSGYYWSFSKGPTFGYDYYWQLGY